MGRIETILTGGLGLAVASSYVAACTDGSHAGEPPCTTGCDAGAELTPDASSSGDGTRATAVSTDGLKNGSETDVDCGGGSAPPCAEGKSCLADGDCTVACSYAHECIAVRSCKPHLGGDTCGKGEVGEPDAVHESCCKTLPVTGYVDPRVPTKKVYLDKYEITSGRVRTFISDISAKYAGKPNIKDWITKNTPPIWNADWTEFLPSDHEAGTVHVYRQLLGDVRGGPDAPPVPAADQDRSAGLDFQFNAQFFVYLHGHNCSTHEGSFGFPTFFYPASILAKQGPDTFPPRADGTTASGMVVPANEHLDVKAMNCITNALLTAFCHWDGGQLATDEVLDFVTASPRSGDAALGDKPGCGTQIGTEIPPSSDAAMKGGRCADLALVNATFDAGEQLPVPGSPLNVSNYMFPFFAAGVTHDKAWEVAAPGRGSLAAAGAQVDVVRIDPGDEPWMDLAGNLNEAVLTMNAGMFTGKFGLKFRGLGYQSSRSPLNITVFEGEGGLRRIERPEARSALTGGRCMRFK
ncbi:MAG: hypothetical protein JWP87_5444 [Labilithrix sp.]|nr:hypothetical protein [Labilithrix sp.]